MDDKHYVIDDLQLLPSPEYPMSANYTCGMYFAILFSELDYFIYISILGHQSPLSAKIEAEYVRRKRALDSKPAYYKKFVTWKELYVELAIVFDSSMVSG